MKILLLAMLMAGISLIQNEAHAQSGPQQAVGICMQRGEFIGAPVRSILGVRPTDEPPSSFILAKSRRLVEEWSTGSRWIVTVTDSSDRLCIIGDGSRV